VVDDRGEEAKVSLEVNVNLDGNALPRARLLPLTASGTVPFKVNFDASTSTDSDGEVMQYEWDFDGDGSFDGYGSDATISHTYTTPGIFSVRMRVTDDAGAQTSAQSTVTVNALSNTPPVAEFTRTPATGDAPLDVAFDATGSHDPDGRIVRYDWDFDGDGGWDAYDSGPQVSHFYTRPGLYSARLRVTDDSGTQTSVRDGIDVQVPGNFAPDAALTVTPNLDVEFGALLDAGGSVDTDGSIVKYEWDFDGDGTWDSYGESPTVSHDYGALGTYTPLVRVTDDDGSQDVAFAEIGFTATPNEPPIANFTQSVSEGSYPLKVDFDASVATDADGTIVLYEWDFNSDGTWDGYSSFPTASFIYAGPGEFGPTLRVTDDDGAQGLASGFLVVDSGPQE
jgi:PKD repeat protein